MNAQWKDVVGYEGLYQVSNSGLVKSLDRKITYKNGVKHFYKSVIKAPYIDKCGYLVVSLCKLGVPKAQKTHRLVAQSFIPNPENKPEVNHKDGNKKNNNDWNLEWNTSQENKNHAFKKGFYNNSIGEKHYRAKLTKEQVKEIRKKYIPYKYSTIKLAKEYNVSKSTMFSIVANKAWKIYEKSTHFGNWKYI